MQLLNCLIFLGFGVLGFCTSGFGLEKPYLYINVDATFLRSEPNTESDKVRRLNYGEKLKYMGRKSTMTSEIRVHCAVRSYPWLHVEDSKGNKGWVYGGVLQGGEIDVNTPPWKALVVVHADKETADAKLQLAKRHCSSERVEIVKLDPNYPCLIVGEGKNKQTLDLAEYVNEGFEGFFLRRRMGRPLLLRPKHSNQVQKIKRFCKK